MAIKILENIPLKTYTTFKTGGVARFLVEVTTEEEVDEAARFVEQTALPHLILGEGSNLLIADEGFAGVVILNQLKGRQYSEQADGTVNLVCQSGELLDEVVVDCVARDYWGLENLSSIPGTVGATPVQNVGAYGVEIGDLISQVETYHLETNTRNIFTKEECNFSYRESFFKTENGKNYFITAVHLKLTKNISPNINYADLKKQFSNTKPSLKDIRNAVIKIRSQKFPDWRVLGTAGSFFKNPIILKSQADQLHKLYPDLPQYEAGLSMVKIPLGYLLDKVCGLKGYRRGNVGLYENQALVLVNYGGATTTEIKNFAHEIVEKVFNKTRIVITPEVNYIENFK